MSNRTADPRVAVVGAGIAGLATAAALASRGLPVTVFERPDARPAGAGISLFGNGLRALAAIGIHVGPPAPAARQDVPAGLRRSDGAWLTKLPPAAHADLAVVHRADLHDLLVAAAPAIRYEQVDAVDPGPAGATVVLADGRREEFDLVVAADGIGSRIRRGWPDDPGIRYTGYTAWRGVTAQPFTVPAAGESWGRGERFGIAPLTDGRVYWFAVATVPAGGRESDEAAEVRRRFAGWHDPIGRLLDATDDAAVLRNDIIELAAPLRSFVRGRVVLVGDAAHAMTPNLGQGGNQALEDAVTLAAQVAAADRGEAGALDAALARYDVSRRRRTTPIMKQARRIGRIGQADGRFGVALRNAVARLTPAAVTARASARMQAWEPPRGAGHP